MHKPLECRGICNGRNIACLSCVGKQGIKRHFRRAMVAPVWPAWQFSDQRKPEKLALQDTEEP